MVLCMCGCSSPTRERGAKKRSEKEERKRGAKKRSGVTSVLHGACCSCRVVNYRSFPWMGFGIRCRIDSDWPQSRTDDVCSCCCWCWCFMQSQAPAACYSLTPPVQIRFFLLLLLLLLLHLSPLPLPLLLISPPSDGSSPLRSSPPLSAPFPLLPLFPLSPPWASPALPPLPLPL